MSLDKLTEVEAEALVRLQEQPDFKVFLGLLGMDMAQLNEQLIKKDLANDDQNRLIGQLRLGTRLTDAVVKSKHTLEQHRQPKT